MTETAQAPVEPPARLTPLTSSTQERKIGVRRLDPLDRADRVVRVSRLPHPALTWILGLVVLLAVLVWLVVVPVVDLAVAAYGRARRLVTGLARQ